MVFLKVGIPLNMNMTYKTICISSGCNLEVPTILLEKYLKQSNDIITFTTTEHHFIRNSRVLTVQKVNSTELYWILITTTEYKATSQKYFEKKIH